LGETAAIELAFPFRIANEQHYDSRSETDLHGGADVNFAGDIRDAESI
jgi:hypothetical protein